MLLASFAVLIWEFNMVIYHVAEIYAEVIFSLTGLPDSEYDTPISTEVYETVLDNFYSILVNIL